MDVITTCANEVPSGVVELISALLPNDSKRLVDREDITLGAIGNRLDEGFREFVKIGRRAYTRRVCGGLHRASPEGVRYHPLRRFATRARQGCSFQG